MTFCRRLCYFKFRYQGVVHTGFGVVLVVITQQDSEDTLDLQPDSTHVNGARLLLHIFCAIKVPLF